MVSQTVLCCDWLYMASGDLNSGPHPACLPSPDPSSKSMTIAPEPTVGASKTVVVNKTVNLGKVTGSGCLVQRWVCIQTLWTAAHLGTVSQLSVFPSLSHYPLEPTDRLPSPSQVCTYLQLCRSILTPDSGSSLPIPSWHAEAPPTVGWALVSWTLPQPTRELPGRLRGVLIYHVRSMLYQCLFTNAR